MVNIINIWWYEVTIANNDNDLDSDIETNILITLLLLMSYDESYY